MLMSEREKDDFVSYQKGFPSTCQQFATVTLSHQVGVSQKVSKY